MKQNIYLSINMGSQYYMCRSWRVHFMLIRMKFNYAHPAVQICADVHFFVLIRTGVTLELPTLKLLTLELLTLELLTLELLTLAPKKAIAYFAVDWLPLNKYLY
jgi:hypothetical protein